MTLIKIYTFKQKFLCESFCRFFLALSAKLSVEVSDSKRHISNSKVLNHQSCSSNLSNRKVQTLKSSAACLSNLPSLSKKAQRYIILRNLPTAVRLDARPTYKPVVCKLIKKANSSYHGESFVENSFVPPVSL